MTSQTRATLKSYFNTNDQPTEAQFADLIDSAVNLLDGPASLLPTGATVGATSQTQVFTYGAFGGTLIDARPAMFHASEAITAHAHYGFLDTSELAFSVPGLYGHASFADDITIKGTENQDHHHGFQTSAAWESSGTLARMAGLHSILEVKAGTATSVEHVAIFDVIGAGAVGSQYGVKIANLSKGTANWSIFTGSTPSYFGGTVYFSSSSANQNIKLTTVGLGETASDGMNIGILADGRAFFLNYENSPLSFYTNALERLRITETGDIGIGTSAPQANLDIGADAGGVIIQTDPSLAHGMTVLAPTNAFFQVKQVTDDSGGAIVSGYTSASLDGALRLRGIQGVTDPTDSHACILIQASKKNGTAVQALGALETVIRIDNLGTNPMVILGSGNVGIGDTAPAEALDVTGNINTTGVVKVDDVQVLSNRVIDARCADVANSGDATTDGLIDALRDALVAHGLIAAA